MEGSGTRTWPRLRFNGRRRRCRRPFVVYWSVSSLSFCTPRYIPSPLSLSHTMPAVAGARSLGPITQLVATSHTSGHSRSRNLYLLSLQPYLGLSAEGETYICSAGSHTSGSPHEEKPIFTHLVATPRVTVGEVTYSYSAGSHTKPIFAQLIAIPRVTVVNIFAFGAEVSQWRGFEPRSGQKLERRLKVL